MSLMFRLKLLAIWYQQHLFDVVKLSKSLLENHKVQLLVDVQINVWESFTGINFTALLNIHMHSFAKFLKFDHDRSICQVFEGVNGWISFGQGEFSVGCALTDSAFLSLLYKQEALSSLTFQLMSCSESSKVDISTSYLMFYFWFIMQIACPNIYFWLIDFKCNRLHRIQWS